MGFILKMAWRDSRASRRRLVLVSLSIVLGIAALVGISSVGDNLQRTVELQTKALLGSDLTITSRQDFKPETLEYFRSLGGQLAGEVGLTSMVTFPTRGNQRRLAQVRALEGGFPFYGELVTEPHDARAQLDRGDFAILEDSILIQFGVQLGDEVKIGEGTFRVAGALKKIPGESAAVAMFSPRVYLSRAALDKTNLLQRQGFVTHREHFKLPPTVDAEKLVEQMRPKFRGQRLQYATVEERKRDLGQSLKDVYSFLSLVGFIALFLGAVGVASAMHVYIRQKITTVAVLRCLGASARTSFSIYVVQGIALGVLGAVIGASLGVAVQLLLPHVLKDFLPFEVTVFISWPAVLKGSAAGVVICVLFTLLPLLAVRRVSPLVAIRSAQGETTRADPWRNRIYLGISVAVVGFAILQAGHWKPGLGFALMMGLGFAALGGMAKLVSWLAQRYTARLAPSYVWRQGLANLHRPNNRTVLLLLSLGLGTFLMLTLVLTRATLLEKIMGVGAGTRPNLLFFDIQDDQIGPLEKLAKQEGSPLVAEAPIVTMRISALRGIPLDALLKDDKSSVPAWTVRREYRSTFRGELSTTEKLTAGKFVGAVTPGTSPVPVSVEQDLAKELQVKLGDRITFDVQGVPMETYVASLRDVEWQRMQPNFFVVFPLGVLEPAPKTYMAATRAATPADSARLQQAVGRDLPSVSAIDLALLLQTFDGIFSKVAFVITFMSGFTVLTGIIVLAGAVLTGRYQRIRETVLLRTLGATQRQLTQIQMVEYAVLGVLAAITGGALAVLANGLLAKFIFKTGIVAPPLVLLTAVGAAVAVTLVTGLLTNRGVANHPPLEILRQET